MTEIATRLRERVKRLFNESHTKVVPRADDYADATFAVIVEELGITKDWLADMEWARKRCEPLSNRSFRFLRAAEAVATLLEASQP